MTPKSSPLRRLPPLSAYERRRPLPGDWLRLPPVSHDVPLQPNPLSPRANFLLQVTLSCRIGVRGKEKRRSEQPAEKVEKERRKLQKERVCVCVCCRCLASASCLRRGRLPLPPSSTASSSCRADGYEQLCGLLSDNCSLLIYNVKLNDSLGPAPSGP